MSQPSARTPTPAETPPENPLGAVSIVVGGFAALLATIPLVGLYVFWVPAIVAISLAMIALVRAGRRGLPRTLAVVGLVLGVVSFLIAAGWLALGAIIPAVSDHFPLS